jgi:hypothetical protein
MITTRQLMDTTYLMVMVRRVLVMEVLVVILLRNLNYTTQLLESVSKTLVAVDLTKTDHHTML